jgi:hypothetical protein
MSVRNAALSLGFNRSVADRESLRELMDKGGFALRSMSINATHGVKTKTISVRACL